MGGLTDKFQEGLFGVEGGPQRLKPGSVWEPERHDWKSRPSRSWRWGSQTSSFRGAHASKIAKRGAARVVVVQGRASPHCSRNGATRKIFRLGRVRLPVVPHAAELGNGALATGGDGWRGRPFSQRQRAGVPAPLVPSTPASRTCNAHKKPATHLAEGE